MQHFYVKPEQIDGLKVTLTEEYNHIKNVLRMKTGEAFMVADGSGSEYYCIVSEYTDKEVIAEISYKQESEQELSCPVTIYQGLPKGDKLELIIQKCVELGAVRIVPVEMKRSIMKLDDKKAAAKQKRWQSIAEAAASQCGRAVVPEVSLPVRFKAAMEEAKDMEVKLFPYELAGEISPMEITRNKLNSIKPGERIAVFIGPEGGFDESEVELAKEYGYEPITLGKRILRTETAGLYVMSVLGYLLEK